MPVDAITYPRRGTAARSLPLGGPLVCVLLGAAAIAACSSAPDGDGLSGPSGSDPDASMDASSPRSDRPDAGGGAEADGGGGTPGVDAGGPVSVADAGTDAQRGGPADAGADTSQGGGTDASSPPPPPGGGVFTGAPAYVSQSGGNGHHNPGRNCFECHGLTAPTFTAAGTVYDAKGAPLSNVEVRVVDSAGNAFSMYSGTNGNFFRQGSPITLASHAGIRNTTATVSMVSATTEGACNSCHCTGTGCAAARIHLP